MKVQYHFQRILTGSDLSRRRLPLMEIETGISGPCVWITACAHGDEVTGSVVIQELFRKLRKTQLIKGSLRAFPLMNSLGVDTSSRHLPYSDEDLNRAFPGKPDGTLAERIAHQIFSTIVATKPDLVLDLHNDWTKTIPYAVLDPLMTSGAYSKAESFARNSGLPVLRETEPDSGTLSGSLLEHGVPSVTLELGESYVVNEAYVDVGVQCILNMLSELGMITNHKHYVYEYPFRGRILTYSNDPKTNRSGIIRFFLKPGSIVKKGQPVARVYNAFGRLLETLNAPGDAILIGHADYSVSFPGFPVIVFGLL